MSHILVVDDEFDLVQVIKGILEDEGHTVAICNNGRQVFERFVQKTGEAKVPDLILLDVVMPFVGGIEVLKRIRKEEALCNVPTVLMHNTDLDPRKADCEWDHFLKKPFNMASLLRVLDLYTGSHKSPGTIMKS